MKWSLPYNAGFGGQYQYLHVYLCYKTKKLCILMNHICISLTTLKKIQSHKLLIDYTNEKSIFTPPQSTPFLFSVCHILVLKSDYSLHKYFCPDFASSAWDASQKIYRKGIHPPKTISCKFSQFPNNVKSHSNMYGNYFW